MSFVLFALGIVFGLALYHCEMDKGPALFIMFWTSVTFITLAFSLNWNWS